MKASTSSVDDLGEDQDDANTEPLPTSVGSYAIQKRIMGGGMAEVLLAHKMSRFGYVRRAVIKRVQSSQPGYRGLQRMLLDEARATAFLDHPNVVSILDVDEDESGIYIALEHVEGTDLRWVNAKLRSRREALPFELACFITAEVLRGLHHAHSALGPEGEPLEIVHRDVNPSNVLISLTGHVKLTDFGVVRMKQRVQPETEAGLVKGKYAYLAPEYIAGEPCTQRSDLYATGVMLFELLTGRECFSGTTTYEVMWKIVNRGVPYYRLARERVPDDLSRIIQKATSQVPEHRYASAREMANALETWLIRHGKHATPWVLSAFFRRHGLYPDELARGPSAEPAAGETESELGLRVPDSFETPSGPSSSIAREPRPREESLDVHRASELRHALAPRSAHTPSTSGSAVPNSERIQTPAHAERDRQPRHEGIIGIGPSELPTDPNAAQATHPIPLDRVRAKAAPAIPLGPPRSSRHEHPTLPSIPGLTQPTRTPKPQARDAEGPGEVARPSRSPSTTGTPRMPPAPPGSKKGSSTGKAPLPPQDPDAGYGILIEEPEEATPVASADHASEMPTPHPDANRASQSSPAKPSRGRLEETPPARALAELRHQGASGVLEFKCGLIWKRVQLDHGEPVAITSNMGMELIGEHLVKARVLSRRELDRALHAADREGLQLTAKLIEFGLIEKAKLEEELGNNLSARLSEVLEWRWGSFEFHPQTIEPVLIRPKLDLDALLSRALDAHGPSSGEDAHPPEPPAPEDERAKLRDAFNRTRTQAEGSRKGHTEQAIGRPARAPTPKR